MFSNIVLLFMQHKLSCVKKRTLQMKSHKTGIETVDDKKGLRWNVDSIERLQRACLTPHHPQLEWVVQPQGLLIEKLSAMRCRTQTHMHTCPLSCSRMSPVLMKHSPYPLPSLSHYIPIKWVWWGSIRQANRVRIVLLCSYLPSALQLSAYEDTGGVLSVFSP